MSSKGVFGKGGRFRVKSIHLRRPRELLGLLTGRPSPRRVRVDTSLRFLHDVLGLERFQYGLWDGEPLNVNGLEAAQARYSKTLHSWIPEGVKSLLDVGCGIGVDALELSRQGYEVEGLSPDPYQEREFRRRTGLVFHLCRLQDFEAPRTYDLLLMSESAQYVWLERLFSKVRELAPGGHLLLADYFVVGKPSGTASGHPLEAFLRQAEDAGFEVKRQQDFTEQVLPTLDLFTQWLTRYVEPTLDIVEDDLRRRHPRTFALARRLARPLATKLEAQRRLFDRQEFQRTKRYLLMLLAVPAEERG